MKLFIMHMLLHSASLHHLKNIFEILRFSLDLSWSERKTIRVSEIERDHDIRIVAFEREDGSASSIPTSDSVLYDGDSVMVVIRHDLIDSFTRYIQD